MPTAAANSISSAKASLKNSIANSAQFQTLVGAANATEAKDSIYIGSTPPPANGEEYTLAELQAQRPFALIYSDEETGLYQRMQAGGTRHWFRGGGRLKFWIERDVPSGIAGDEAEVEVTMDNIAGGIVDELCVLAGQAGYLALTEIAASNSRRAHEDVVPSQGDFQVVMFDVMWGAR